MKIKQYISIALATLLMSTSTINGQVLDNETPQPQVIEYTVPSSNEKLDKILELAHTKIGRPYVWGNTGQNDSYDCSGLTQWLYKQVGINIPRTAQAQYYGLSNKVSYENLKAGDLVYFHTSNRCEITHTGIMISDTEFIHAANKRDGVKKSSIRSNYYRNAFRGGRRLL